jgi:hypothetical protein
MDEEYAEEEDILGGVIMDVRWAVDDGGMIKE